jgi:hypothetical protein
MTTSSRNPTNRDLLQSTKFRLNFTRLSGLTFFCQTANLPGISLSEVIRNTPFVDLYAPGEKAIYDTLNVTMLIDEELHDWEAIHDWIRAMTFPKEFEEYAKMGDTFRDTQMRRGSGVKLPVQYSDCSMTIYSNKNNPTMRVQFKDVFPTTLGGIQFSALDSSENIITADITFRYSYYNIERV